MGHTDLHCRPHRRCHDCALGHQGRDASRDIRFANALSVIDGPAFAAYVEKVLVPGLAPGTVVILPSHRIAAQYDCRAMDNLATHKNAVAAKAMRDAGCWFLFRCSGKRPTGAFSDPSNAYSPDLNPIEMAFSKLKAHLRRIGARTFTDMFEAIAKVCEPYSPQQCWSYFKAAGYVSG